MPHTPQDAMLAAILHVLDAPRGEDGQLRDPEKLREEVARIASYTEDDDE